MKKAFGAVATVSALGTIFFIVGATTGPAGAAAVSSYAGTIGTGSANTLYGGVEAFQWGYEAATPFFS